MAVASEQIRADCIDASEFRERARRYSVMAVPKVIINDRVEFEGALPEAEFVTAVLRAVDGVEAPA
jgi:predicted DsbA family dithiol-disulfide isomerase